MVEITDEESAKAWLKTQPQEICVAMAARAALRSVPGIGFANPERLSGLALPVFRALITSGVAAFGPTAEVEDAADSAYLSARSVAEPLADSTYSAAHSAACSAESAARSVADPTYAARSTAESADSASFSARFAVPNARSAARSAAITALSEDASTREPKLGRPAEATDLLSAKLWRDVSEPQGLQQGREHLIAFFEADEHTWAFWKRWYLAMFNGTWRDWDLARNVALIPNDVWKQGAAAVAEAIKGIEAARKPLSSQAAHTQAQALLQNPRRAALCAAGLAQMLDTAIRDVGNCLPDPFEAAEPLQKHLHQISGVLLANHLSDQEAQLAKLLELTAETVAQLVRDLQDAKSEIAVLEAKLAAATTAAEKAELLSQAKENPKVSWRSKVGDAFYAGVGGFLAATLFSGQLWAHVDSSLDYLLGPTASQVVAETSECFNGIIDPEYLDRSTRDVIVET